MLWLIVWLYFSSESPGKHKSISKEERSYIETTINENTVAIAHDVSASFIHSFIHSLIH